MMFKCLLFWVVALNFITAQTLENRDNFDAKSDKCGYDSCPQLSDELIHVHLVPHTHDDVGWLKNPEEYLYGARDDIQRADVMYIIDSVVDELLKDENRRFIYVEMYFFSNWWKMQSESRKDQVKMLVQNGQLVFINGGWSMNDEAATHYNAIIDQMSLGMRFLNDTFGTCGIPKIAWHIDPFGHSREQANLFTMMNFDSFFFARIDYADKNKRLNENRLEELWNAGNADLFFGALYDFYGPPAGFCFDGIDCSDEPIIDDETSYEYNVPRRVAEFVEHANTQASHMKSNHIMMTMGSDFQYMMASKWYTNLDKLILHVNKLQSNGSKLNLLYSTPMCYTYALNKRQIEWTNKADDFFPYASDPQSYWTGYFTSRPAQKGYIRRMNNLLQIARQLSILRNVTSSTDGIKKLERAMGVNQHHDAVTGTEKQQVQDYYVQLLHDAATHTQKDIQNWLSLPSVDFCPYRNISVCPLTETSSKFTVALYNPLARNVTYYVRFPVSKTQYVIKDANNNVVTGDIFPVVQNLQRLRKSHNSNAQFELSFPATLKGLSMSTYTVEESMATNPMHVSAQLQTRRKYKIINSRAHELHRSFRQTTGNDFESSFSFAWYNASTGKNKEPASGAYCFRPEKQTPITMLPSSFEHFQGKVCSEERYNFSYDWVSMVARSCPDKRYIEYEWLIGPIPVEDGIAKEIIVQYNTNLTNNNTFYTDANGRQILKRIKDYRPTWNLNNTEPVSQNYYPINSRIFIRDEEKGLQSTVLTDRSEGGTSMNNGQIEVMVHRRDLADDGFGVGEPLNETGQFGDGLIVRGVHRHFLTETSDADKLHRLEAEEMFMQPLVFFSAGDVIADLKFPSVNELPENVHLLTLELLPNNNVLLRLEHQFDKNEDATLSKDVTVDLNSLFENVFTIKSARAMSLSGERYADELHRLKWNSTHGDSVDPDLSISGLMVPLKPMEIKTIELEVEYV